MSIRPEDFSTDMPPVRSIGIECEYNLQPPAGSISTNADYVSPARLTKLGIRNHGGYLGREGGSGRVYPDVGHLEYDTGEAMGPASAAVEDIDGVYRISDIVESNGREHGGLYRLAGTYIQDGRVSNSTELVSTGRTSGYHENYLMPRAASNDSLTDRLVPTMLATRFWSMNGTLRNSRFVLSQKVWGIGGDAVERSLLRRTSHGNKPMVIIPPASVDRDTIGSAEWARVEVRLAEPGLSLVDRYLAFAGVSLTLRLVELQKMFSHAQLSQLREMVLGDPVHAARAYAGDLSLSRTAETVGGKQVTGLDTQERFLDFFALLDEKVALPPDEQLAIVAIRGLVDALRASNLAEVDYDRIAAARIGFAARHKFINHRAGKKDDIIGDAHAEMYRNLSWDRVLPRGEGLKYWEKVSAQDGLAAQVRAMARASGGLTPRAKRRARMIDSGNKGNTVLNWAQYRTILGATHSFGPPYGD